jgi:hypothetical protein
MTAFSVGLIVGTQSCCALAGFFLTGAGARSPRFIVRARGRAGSMGAARLRPYGNPTP